MTAREEGFLLLTGKLGNPDRKVLTQVQLRTLAKRVREMYVAEPDRQLRESDLLALGYSNQVARQILSLLEDREMLEYYLYQGKKAGCVPLTRVTTGYPHAIRKKLGLDSPGCLWAKGDLSILERPAVALVGSRELLTENEAFAREVGRQAAMQGCVLVSGNARGADKAAQEACLEAGGQVVSIVADALIGHQQRGNLLYLSEDGFDLPFTAQRAISRNRCVHCMGEKTFVAQCGYQMGGTWDGTVKNLRFGWSPVFCFRDGSPAMELLLQMGAEGIEESQLIDFTNLPQSAASFLNWEETK